MREYVYEPSITMANLLEEKSFVSKQSLFKKTVC